MRRTFLTSEHPADEFPNDHELIEKPPVVGQRMFSEQLDDSVGRLLRPNWKPDSAGQAGGLRIKAVSAGTCRG